MKTSHPLIKNALILTLAGLLARIIGFFNKIFLASFIGAEGLGIYQMVFPIYILCVSLSCSGIQIAITRFTAEKLSLKDNIGAKRSFIIGLLTAFFSSCLLACLLYLFAAPVCSNLLSEKRCLPVLRFMALAIPFETIHACINGYFFGQKKTGIPAVCQLLEQFIRISSALFIFQLCQQKNLPVTPLLAAVSLLTAELAAALFSCCSMFCANKEKRVNRKASSASFRQQPHHKWKHVKSAFYQLQSVALPVTANRFFLNLLQSAEAILIPLQLTRYYHDSSTALASYGVLSGMVLPLILFPCAITSSFSTVLMPAISEANAVNQQKKISDTASTVLHFCLLLGIICTAAFLLFGVQAGLLLYHNTQAGTYLTILAWLCPFMYLNTMYASILHGLGKTKVVFRNNMLGMLIRLLFTILFIPVFGIFGCLSGLLCSQLLSALLNVCSIRKLCTLHFNAIDSILFPILLCICATLLLQILQELWPFLTRSDNWISFLLSVGIWCCFLLFLLPYTYCKDTHL